MLQNGLESRIGKNVGGGKLYITIIFTKNFLKNIMFRKKVSQKSKSESISCTLNLIT